MVAARRPCLGSSPTRSGLGQAPLLPLVMMLLVVTSLVGGANAAPTAPNCSISAFPKEADVRTPGLGGVKVSILNAFLPTVVPGNAAALLGLTSTSGQITVQSVSFITDQTPHLLQINLLTLPNYDIWVPDSVSFAIPGSFLLNSTGAGCTGMSFQIRPSPGTVSLSTLPLAITEVDVNTNGVQFPLQMSHDHFLSNNVSVTMNYVTEGFLLEFFVTQTCPCSSITLKIHKNETFNIPRNSPLIISVTIPPQLTRSGISPIIGDEIYGYTAVTVTIQGSQPFVNTEYSGGGSGIPAEDLWDGTAAITLTLLGDTWRNDTAYWYNRTHGPLFEVSRPIQPNGFTLFLGTDLWPSVTITARRMVLRFPARPGFALTTSPVESVDVKLIYPLISESTGCVTDACTGSCTCANFRILKATPARASVAYQSEALFNNMTEVDIRRRGLTLTAQLRYDIFSSSGTSAANIRAMFVVNAFLSLDAIQFSVTNYSTLLHLTIPAQISYNIDSDNALSLTLPKALSATQTDISNAPIGFIIRAIPTPGCTMSSYVLTEKDIRTNGALLDIKLTNDAFCFTPAPTGTPLASAQVTALLGGIKSQYGGLQYALRSLQNDTITIAILRNYSYDISRTDVVVVPVPRDIMCSLEYCRAVPAAISPEPFYSMSIPIRRVAGDIIATFPNTTEDVMRGLTINLNVTLVGETFAMSVFRPSFAMVTEDPLRGFTTSNVPKCTGTRDRGNYSIAAIYCPANATYDISAPELATIGFDVAAVAGAIMPLPTFVRPLHVFPVRGTLSTVNVTRHADLTEEQVIAGGTLFIATLLYERFNATALTDAIVNSILMTSAYPHSDGGVSSTARSMFAPAAFTFNTAEDELHLRMQPAPRYDITREESFSFDFNADAVAGSVAPINNRFTIRVSPSAGQVSFSGSAAVASARQVLEQSLTFSITLTNDIWVEGASFRTADMCPIGPCTVKIDASLRVLTLIFEPNPNFYIYANTTFPVLLRAEYLMSNILPPQPVSIFIYVSAGRLTWLGPATMTEDQVRDGSAPSMRLNVDGDLLGDLLAVRSALTASVTCGSGGTSDKYDFCGRAAVLFAGIGTTVHASRRILEIQLQADEEFDIFEPQNVTLRLSSEALVSRLNPRFNESLTFVVIPTTGRYFLSGFNAVLSERDISGTTRATVQVVLTLYGERWLANRTLLIPLLLTTVVSDAGVRESHGFTRYKDVMILPAAATVSETGRVLTVQFTPAPKYDIFFDETITIAVGGACVLSGMVPQLSSLSNKMTIQSAGGLITLSPTATTAAVMATTGVDLKLTIEADQWKTDVVQNAARVLEAIRISSSPQQEPNGFAVNLDVASTDIKKRGSSINGTSLIITIMPMPTYTLRKSEVITLALATGWTTSGLPLVPSTFTLTISPVYFPIECVVYVEPFKITAAPSASNGSSSVITATDGFSLTEWRRKAAAALAVPDSYIDIMFYGPELKLPSPTSEKYRRLRFRVLTPDGSDDPYNNAAASTFVALSATYLMTTFSVRAAFLNNTPPADAFWLSLQPAPAESSEFVMSPANRNILFAIIGAVIIGGVVCAIYLVRRSRRDHGGVTRATEKDTTTALRYAARKHEAQQRDRALEGGIYAGQHAATSGNGSSAGGILNVPESDELGLGLGGVSNTGGARSHHIQFDYQLPLDLYAGQGAAFSPGPSAPPSPLREVTTSRLPSPAHSHRDHYSGGDHYSTYSPTNRSADFTNL